MSRDRNKCKVTEIELMAYEMERLFIEAEIKQTLPKKHPSIVKAEALYNAGYRKQSEGEWIQDAESNFVHRYHCSVCNFYLIGEPTKYCEDCGAKMKGGAE